MIPKAIIPFVYALDPSTLYRHNSSTHSWTQVVCTVVPHQTLWCRISWLLCFYKLMHEAVYLQDQGFCQGPKTSLWTQKWKQGLRGKCGNASGGCVYNVSKHISNDLRSPGHTFWSSKANHRLNKISIKAKIFLRCGVHYPACSSTPLTRLPLAITCRMLSGTGRSK